MVIAIYARKSVFSDKSDSIETQTKLCADYIKTNYPDATITIYEDEGYSGATTIRPRFTELMKDIKSKKINVLVCYKIDRISRNVLDFSNTFNELQTNHVEFVSIKEQIDTSSPLGRAMMYICSVFAQMERETIAERITDNMIELAKDGKWTGGIAPLGYKITKQIINGKKHSILTINDDELPFLNMIYDTFINGHTLSSLETYFKSNNIKTINGRFMSSSQLHKILSTPYYVQATPKVYDYFESKGCQMSCEQSLFDGSKGVMVYGRTTGGKKKKHMLNPPDKWIVCVGKHDYIFSDEKWLAVQEKFGKNTIDKTRKHNIGILKGILKCQCGCTMRTKYKHDKQYDVIYKHYFCKKRMQQGVHYCNTPMLRLDDIDNAVLNIIKSVALDKQLLYKYINNHNSKNINTPLRNEKVIRKEMNDISKKIRNLTKALQESMGSVAAKYIIQNIENLDKMITELNIELKEVEKHNSELENAGMNIDEIYNKILYLHNNLGNLEYEEVNKYLSDIIVSCVWKDNELYIRF